MAWTSKAILAVVELVIYLVLLFPYTYSAYKHGKRGIFTHIYLFIFIMLRIVADGLEISNRNKTTSIGSGGAIVNPIGLSPLLLASAALLNMIRMAMKGQNKSARDKRMTIVIEILVHMATIGGVAILATGFSNLAKADSVDEVNNDYALAEAGGALLVVVWVALCVWAALLFRKRHTADADQTSPGFALRLLTFTILALPFVGARAVYSLVYAADHSPDVNPVTGGFAVQFVAIFLIELIAFLCILTGLLLTMNTTHTSRQYQNAPGFGFSEREEGNDNERQHWK